MSAPPISRLVGERQVSVVRDAAAVWRVLDDDPIESCMVAARVADHGIDPNAIGGELWTRRGAHESLCFAGANLIPLRGGPIDLNAFADVAMSTPRRCSSLVGRADLVLPMWQRLEPVWGPARDVRDNQPLMALATHPSCAIDTGVRQVRPEELDSYLVAAVDMFIGEVGVDPRLGDGWSRLSSPGGRPHRGRTRVGPIRARSSDLQGRSGIAISGRRADPGGLGSSGVARYRSGHGWYRNVGRSDRRQRAHRQPVCEQLQHGGPCRLRPGGL